MYPILSMGKISKTFAAILIALSIILTVTLQTTVNAQSNLPNSAPAIEWQKKFSGNYSNHVLESSNLIQTSDGGYAFMDIGYTYQGFIEGATIFKVDSEGNTQWSKFIDLFIGSTIIQTSDKGYEISGWWNIGSPTLIKTDVNGNIQWNQNYTTLPNLGVNYYPIEMFPTAFGGVQGGSIKTSDDGFVSWMAGSGYSGTSPNIIKTDSNNNTQWSNTLTYQGVGSDPLGYYPLILTSIIETSDGAMAALGVGPVGYSTFPSMGIINLVKLEPTLPAPSPTQLPTTIPTVPELSWLLTVPLLLSLLFTTLALRHYKNKCLKSSQ